MTATTFDFLSGIFKSVIGLTQACTLIVVKIITHFVSVAVAEISNCTVLEIYLCRNTVNPDLKKTKHGSRHYSSVLWDVCLWIIAEKNYATFGS